MMTTKLLHKMVSQSRPAAASPARSLSFFSAAARSRSRRSVNRLPLTACCLLFLAPKPGLAHPMGNFSISHYAGIRIDRTFVELRYILDMAEIPTFLEMQQTGIKPQASDSA